MRHWLWPWWKRTVNMERNRELDQYIYLFLHCVQESLAKNTNVWHFCPYLLCITEFNQPTSQLVNAVKFIFEEGKVPNLTLLTTDCLAVIKFRFIPTGELGQPRTPYLTMISHGDKKEIRIEGDKEEAT